jgi:hypothetical protein
VKQSIPDFFWVRNKGRKKAFLFSFGSKGQKPLLMSEQIKQKKQPPTFSSACLQEQEAFIEKWRAAMKDKEVYKWSFPLSSLPASENSTSDGSFHIHLASDSEGDQENAVGQSERSRRRKLRQTLVGSQSYYIPNGYKAVHILRLSRLEAADGLVKAVRDAKNKNKYNPSEQQRIILGTFGAKWPQVGDTAVEQFLSTGGIQLASQTGLFKIENGEYTSELEFDHISEVFGNFSDIRLKCSHF